MTQELIDYIREKFGISVRVKNVDDFVLYTDLSRIYIAKDLDDRDMLITGVLHEIGHILISPKRVDIHFALKKQLRNIIMGDMIDYVLNITYDIVVDYMAPEYFPEYADAYRAGLRKFYEHVKVRMGHIRSTRISKIYFEIEETFAGLSVGVSMPESKRIMDILEGNGTVYDKTLGVLRTIAKVAMFDNTVIFVPLEPVVLGRDVLPRGIDMPNKPPVIMGGDKVKVLPIPQKTEVNLERIEPQWINISREDFINLISETKTLSKIQTNYCFYSLWRPSEPIKSVDWLGSIRRSGILIPTITILKKEPIPTTAEPRPTIILFDNSYSMDKHMPKALATLRALLEALGEYNTRTIVALFSDRVHYACEASMNPVMLVNEVMLNLERRGDITFLSPALEFALDIAKKFVEVEIYIISDREFYDRDILVGYLKKLSEYGNVIFITVG